MQKYLIYLLAIGTFMIGTVEFIIMGIINRIAHDLHVSVALAGQLVSIYALAVALGSIVIAITGKIERKKMLIYSLFLFTIGNALSFFSTNFILLMLSRILLGLSGGVFTVISLGIATKLVAVEKRGSAIGIIIMGFSAAQVLGVPFGTIVSEYMNWKYLFIFMAVLTFLLMLILYFTLPKIEGGGEPITFQMQMETLKNKNIWIALMISFSFTMGLSMVSTYITPFLQSVIDISTEFISLALLLAGIGSVVGSRFGGYATDKWGVRPTLLLGLLIHAILLFIMPVFASTAGLIILIMLWMTVSSTTIPAQSYYLTTLAPKTADIALSANTSIFQLGNAIGAGLGGLVIGYSTVGNMSWLAALVILLAFFVSIYSFSMSKTKNSTFA